MRVIQRTIFPPSQSMTATQGCQQSLARAKRRKQKVSQQLIPFPFPFLFRPKQQLQGKGIIAHPNPRCQINQVKFKFQVPSRVWRKDRTTIVGTFCTAPLPVNDR
jgi:hypothetical protein